MRWPAHDLLLGVEQGDLADLLQVVLDRVGGGTGGGDLLRGRVVLVLVGRDRAGALGALRLVGDLGVLRTSSSEARRRPSWPWSSWRPSSWRRPSWRPSSWRSPSWRRPSWRGRPLRRVGCCRGGGRRGGSRGRGGLPGGHRLRRDRLGGGALRRALRCDALAGALGLCGTDHQRHTLFLKNLVEAAQYVLPLSGRNLVSFEGPTHIVAGDLPLSLSPLNERHDRDRTRRSPAGAYGMCWPTRTTSRNVGKRLPAPSTADGEPTTGLGMGRRRGRGPGRCSA